MQMTFAYRDNQAYGWPFFMARKLMRGAGTRLLRAADAMSMWEKYPARSLARPITPANASLKNRHQGETCFVIGNGPSLASQDLSPLRGKLTLAMNGFWRHPLVDVLQPTYYLFADGVFFDGSSPCDEFLANVRRTIHSSTFIAPYAAGASIEARNLLPAGRTHYVAFAGKLRSANLGRVDLTRPLPTVINCAQLAIFSALYMGFKKIHLLGLDHDWLAQRGPETHFYQAKTIDNHAVAHGDMDRHYYKNLIQDSMDLWNGYEAIARYAARAGVEIFNCTAGGFLDVFPRLDLTAAVAGQIGSDTQRRAA